MMNDFKYGVALRTVIISRSMSKVKISSAVQLIMKRQDTDKP